MSPIKRSKSNSKPQSSPYAVPALERGMQIIEILAEARRPLSLTEISGKMHLSSGMVYRLLRQMQQQQWLMQDGGSQKYSLSLRLYSFALSTHPHAVLVEAARTPLQELAATIGQSCHLSILVGSEIVVIASSDAPNPIRLTVDTGSRHRAADTTSGRLLLALQASIEKNSSKNTLSAAEIKHVLTHQYAMAHHRNVHGVHDLAVPVELHSGHGAIAVTALDPLAQADNILSYLPALRQAATTIEQAMGLAKLS